VVIDHKVQVLITYNTIALGNLSNFQYFAALPHIDEVWPTDTLQVVDRISPENVKDLSYEQ
jgi:hypothetical protein